jgi:hypothetical protein
VTAAENVVIRAGVAEAEAENAWIKNPVKRTLVAGRITRGA